MSGARNYHAGMAAEGIVERHYVARGYRCLHRRWRSPAGEIDLIFKGADGLVFVEVKTSATLDAALASLGQQQLNRIATAAEAYGNAQERDTKGTDVANAQNRRIDLAAVDAIGRVEVVENITI